MTESAQWYLEVGGKVFTGMGRLTTPALGQFSKEAGVDQGWDLILLQTAHIFDPQPLTPGLIRKRACYYNPELIHHNLDGAAERGWLVTEGDDQYGLTAKGRDVVERYLTLVDETFAGLETLPQTDLKRIAVLLKRVVKNAWALPEPAEKVGLSWRIKSDRGPTIRPVMQVRRRMADLFAFRDDVHIAAWQPYGVDDQTWEALTLVWRGQARTAAELVEQLPHREHTEDSYASALRDLVDRGWVAEQDGEYTVTAEGKTVRQEAEDTTDRLYDAPWTALNQGEMEELKGLLGRLAEAVTVPEEKTD
jgi:DNA-binding PadR family transcriptional regulator